MPRLTRPQRRQALSIIQLKNFFRTCIEEKGSALEAHRKRYLEEGGMRHAEIWQNTWQKQLAYEDRIFPSLIGTPAGRHYLLKRYFEPLAAKAGRRASSCATLRLESDESSKVLKEVSSHSRIENTLNVYTAFYLTYRSATMCRFGRRFSEANNPVVINVV